MRLRRHVWLMAIAGLLGTAPGPALDAQDQGLAALAPRVASYRIEATLDPSARTLTGTEVVTWRNPGTVATNTIRLHLYWNAWRNTDSTWLRQERLGGGASHVMDAPASSFGWQDITVLHEVRPDGSAGANLLPALRFLQPDDGNANDRSLAEVALPTSIAPGQSVQLRVGWRAQVPRPFSRTGGIGTFFFIAHWFPKIGAFDPQGWSARQFYANTEFYADFGAYDVSLTVPRGWTVGATGREASRADAQNATVHRYTQADVHDFAWTTSPDFVEFTRRFEHPGLPSVDMRLLLLPEHLGQEDRHFAATAAALRYYGEWYGPYPYPQITIVDPAWQSEAGGMEYPTIFTAGTRWIAPRGTNQPESVTVHEAGHQFWYAMVASNEVTSAWMDEGLNTYSEERVQSVAFTPNYRVERFFGGFVPWQFRDIPLSRATDGNGLNAYRRSAERDRPATPTYAYWPGSHADITYGKTALWLHTLERYFGWETFRPALAGYFRQWQFKHPTPDDFFAAINAGVGEDMTWFFDQVHRSSNTFDYEIGELKSEAAKSRGFFDRASAAPPDDQAGSSASTAPLSFESRAPEGTFETTVVARRLGEATFPVEVLVRFANGEEARERWDGLDRWRAFTYTKPARAVSAQIDPERVLLLDINYTNNSATLAPQAIEAADTWTLRWMVWLQDLLLTWSFFV